MKITRKLTRQICILLCTILALSAFTLIGASAAGTPDATFTFSDTGITSAGGDAGYSISGTKLTISDSGTYQITGSCADGWVEVKKELTVTLVLEDLTLTSVAAETAPIVIGKSAVVTIEAVGTSTLTDNEDPAGKNEGAAIKAKGASTLTLTGSGTINAVGSCKNGIKGAAETAIIVDGPTLNITAANNGLASDGSLLIKSGKLNITTDNDAIKSEPELEDLLSAGTVTIEGGDITVTSKGDGIQATGLLKITGGSFDFTCGGGYQAALDEETSTKAMKSDTELVITGGTFTLNSSDDGVHSNGDITIEGGTFQIKTGDDAIHADGKLTIGVLDGTGPSITITNCYEGFEASTMMLNSGDGSITASDDGINAANKDLGREYNFSLTVNGGNWVILAGGDGVDSNGDIYLKGGVIESYARSGGGGEGALDYDGTCYYQGGTVLAAGGATTMGMGFGGSKTEGISLEFSDVSVAVGSKIEVKDSDGNVIYSTTCLKATTKLLFASKELESGSSYRLYIDGALKSTAQTSGSNGSILSRIWNWIVKLFTWPYYWIKDMFSGSFHWPWVYW